MCRGPMDKMHLNPGSDGEGASEPDLPHMSDGEAASSPRWKTICVQSCVCGDGASEPGDRSHV